MYPDSKIHNRKPLKAAQLSQGRLKIPIHTCYSNANSKNNKKLKAIDLQKLIQDSPYKFDTKDSPASLPRPLMSAQLSDLSSGVKEAGIPLFFLLRGQESPAVTEAKQLVNWSRARIEQLLSCGTSWTQGLRWRSSCGL
ncbi:unnamed protein product [Fraxinus pennsylvanica]|uniref:Uncharacterized protein n=1 Tax=Fraxinus pennsylvanica TaxID=56036 RepID=A0AAD1ZB11_9LAMI|nr:unnamed protein product [Fraxinus pennsylvanica]